MPSRIFSQLRIPSPPLLDKAFSSKNSSTVSVTEIHPSNMDHVKEHVKRPSLVNLAKRHGGSSERIKSRSNSKDGRHSRDSSRVSSPAPNPVRLGLIMESPPILMIGSPQQSTGAMIAGRVQIVPARNETILEDIVLLFQCTSTTKRPVSDRCRECMSRTNVLHDWKFLSKPKVFSTLDGVHDIPFSHILPGNLPATTHGTLGSIDYSLLIRARTSDGQIIEFRHGIDIKRAVIPGPDKNSLRIFPPTELNLHVILPNTIHPIGEFPVQCRMTGIVTKQDDMLMRWRLRKLTWRVEEHETAISLACAKHAGKVGGEGKGVSHEYTREIGNDELKAGWKTDFSEGQIEGEFLASINPSSQPQTSIDSTAFPTDFPTGFKINHNLILELVIAEEWVSQKKPGANPTATGAARVLRTQFNLNVTHRAGMGISWEDETPPVYEDVPASPPHYGGSETNHTSVEVYEENVHGGL